MRVLQVIDSLKPAGAETLVCQLSQSMRELGIDGEIYALRRTESRLEAEASRCGIKVHYSGIPSLHSPKQIDALRRHVRRNNYDIIHVHLFPAQLWAATASWLDGWTFPLVTTEHSTTNRRRLPLLKEIDRWMYRQYDAIVGVSAGTSAALTGWMTGLSARIRTINNGIRLDSISSVPPMDLKHELGIRDTPLAISIGRCDTPKDYESSIRAVATVKDLHLVIVGDGVLLPRLRRLAQNLAIAHRVHFLGHRNDVIALLKGADFFIQASRWEGFGIAAVEAMAVGLPVIVTDVPGLGDVVGEAGLKFRPGDETSLAACISRMLHDTVLRSQMAIASHARSLEFDIRSTSRQHADLYRLLLSTN